MTLQSPVKPVRLPPAERIAVQDLVCASTLHLDLGEFDQGKAKFHAEAVIDVSSLRGPEFAHADVERYWADLHDYMSGFDATQHMLANFNIWALPPPAAAGDQRTGMRAACISAVRAIHRIDERLWIHGGFLYHELVRADSHWSITKLRYWLRYTQGNDLISEARARRKGLGR
jgi:hypothetical protein